MKEINDSYENFWIAVNESARFKEILMDEFHYSDYLKNRMFETVEKKILNEALEELIAFDEDLAIADPMKCLDQYFAAKEEASLNERGDDFGIEDLIFEDTI